MDSITISSTMGTDKSRKARSTGPVARSSVEPFTASHREARRPLAPVVEGEASGEKDSGEGCVMDWPLQRDAFRLSSLAVPRLPVRAAG
ncbi:hypothetical protein KH5H1_65650 [Corallococcus caeni]|nr:hypothetical protein KH5H1_65650 [Corallococcus sp. KH5-1]